jgi:hypothetical protein
MHGLWKLRRCWLPGHPCHAARKVVKASGREVERSFVRIECSPVAIVPVDMLAMPIKVVKKAKERLRNNFPIL